MTFPLPPNPHALAVLALTVLALWLWSREWIALETSSLLVIVLLAVGFELVPYHDDGTRLRAVDFFHGFGHDALVAVCALMVAGKGLVRTGALEPVGRHLAGLWRTRPRLSLLATLLVGAVLSPFVNNTPIVVLLLPILVGVSIRTGMPSSGVLMPVGLATLVGGMATTIGTSTNLLVVSVASDLGMGRFAMFDFALPAAMAGSVGIAYLWLVAPRLLPEREPTMPDASPRLFSARLTIGEECPYAGRTLSEAVRATGGAMRVERIRREGDVHILPLPDATLRAGDQLTVRDTPANLKEFESVLEAPLYAGEAASDDASPFDADDQQVAEVVIVPGSPVEGLSVRWARFVDRYHLVVIALHRAGRALPATSKDFADLVLRPGDVLLVQGGREQIAELKREGRHLVLDATADLPRSERAPVALAIMIGIVLLAATGVLPIAASATAGALIMIASGCLGWRDASEALSAQVVLLVVASLALGTALLATGGTAYLTRLLLAATEGLEPWAIVSVLMLLMAVLTNVVSNNAAGVIGTPIAIGIAHDLALAPEPFVLAVLFGANMSYATPMAYKTNLLVMNAGGYRFSDFVRIGVPLTVLMWLTLSWVLPALYGF